MLFNSYVFIFLFLPIVLAVFSFVRTAANPAWPVGWLVIASIVYYGYWKPEFLLLLAFSITVNLGFGKLLLDGVLSPRLSQLALIAGIAFNLCLLGYFKYAGFFVANVDHLFGVGWAIPNIILPIGISFITFQKIAFLVDAYRGLVRNFTVLNYALFVTFFPQLIAGPIVHHSEMMPQLAYAWKRDFKADLAVGFSIFIVGLFKKVGIADTVAVYADAGYATVKAGLPLDAASAWIAVLSYTFQIYFDFSGYSDMAVGLARMFGIILPVNFYSPYKSSNIIDFWHRWHMTLSRFLRDYLYFPLGGNRRGPVRRYLNLAIVMLLGGLWHGANWTFVLWGGAHGLLLAINHAWQALPLSRSPAFTGRIATAVGVVATFTAVNLAWVPFRAESLANTRAMFSALVPDTSPLGWASFAKFFSVQFGSSGLFQVIEWFKPRELWPPALPPDYLATAAKPVGLVLLIVAIIAFAMPNTYQLFRAFDPALGLPTEQQKSAPFALSRLDARVAFVLGGMFVFCVLGLSRVSPFLYFQF